jgi:ATP-dependent Clp protease adapter protein ClpS
LNKLFIVFQFSRYCAILLNDEHHVYPEVIGALKRSLACQEKVATDLTEFIDKEGRAVVSVGSYKASHNKVFQFFEIQL